MANSLSGKYALVRYAQETITLLYNALGMGSRVYRGYDAAPQQKGNTITISKPGSFSVQSAPGSAQDVTTSTVSLSLDNWEEVRFALTDKEMHGSMDTIIQDHITPAVYAVADSVDSKLAALYTDIPWFYDVDTSTIQNNIIQPRKQLRTNGVDLRTPGRVHLAVNSTEEANFLGADFFSSQNNAGMDAMAPLRTGSLGTRFGVEVFPIGNVQTHTSGTVVSAGTDNVGAVNNASGYSAGATSMDIDGLSLVETLVAGDSFVIAGNTQRYALTAGTTLSSGAGTITFTPGLAAAVADDAVVTFEDGSGAVNADNYYANMLFHRDAFALATAPLQDEFGSAQARRQGIQVENITDPDTGLSIRARMWYDPDNSKTVFCVDLLYGVITLDSNKAVNLRGDV